MSGSTARWSAGMILGWNFGDGHLNNQSLLDAIQPQCQFAPGELRVVMVESQPAVRADDALEDRRRGGGGVLEEGETQIEPMRAVQPYPTGEYAAAFGRGRAGARPSKRRRRAQRGEAEQEIGKVEHDSVLDAVVVGSGPNGLAAAIALARAGARCAWSRARRDRRRHARAELTLPGFVHDVCSAVHPMGVLSPFFRDAAARGARSRLAAPRASVAHPMRGRPRRDALPLARAHGRRARAGRRALCRLVARSSTHPHELLADVMAPLRIPDAPAPHAALRPARGVLRELARAAVVSRRARARAVRGLRGALGAAALAAAHGRARARCSRSPRTSRTGRCRRADRARSRTRSRRTCAASAARSRRTAGSSALDELPARARVLFDTSPRAARADRGRRAAGGLPPPARALPLRARRIQARLGARRADPVAGPACREASTVHVGGTLEEIGASERDMYRGRHGERPFLILCQQSEFDATRAPAGQHTGYAYCHVPHGSTRRHDRARSRRRSSGSRRASATASSPATR